jgi:hypothetical protein
MLGEVPDGAVSRVKVGDNPLYLFDSSNINELLD